MKVLRKSLVLCLSVFAILFTACNQNVSFAKNGKAYVLLGQNGSARTVTPGFDFSELDSFELSYETEEGLEPVAQWTTYEKATSEKVEINPGTYNFVLNASNETESFTGYAKNILLVKNTVTPLNFVIDLSFLDYENGTGSVKVTMTYPLETAAVSAGLFNLSNNPGAVSYDFNELEQTVEENGKSVVFEKNEIPSGSYRLKFILWGDAAKTVPVATYSEIVYVANGRLSSVDRQITDINKTYSISYELNGGEWNEYTPLTAYSRLSDKIMLPVDGFKYSRDNYEFVALYDNPDFEGEPVSVIPAGSIGDKKFYVKWGKTVKSILLDQTFILFEKADETKTLVATVDIDDNSDYIVSWMSSNPEVASVDENGTVTSHKKGTVTISATVGKKVVNAVAVVMDTSDTLSYDKGTVDSGFLGYKSDAINVVAFKLSGNILDFVGRASTEKDYQETTYSEHGWSFNIDGEDLTSNGTPGDFIYNVNNKNFELKVTPVIAYDSATKTSYVVIYQALTNIGTSTVTDVQFGSHADIQIGANDYAPIQAKDFGLRMYDNSVLLAYDIYCIAGDDCTPVNTLWFGYYADRYRKENMYSGNIRTTNLFDKDTGVSYSWSGITLAPGETTVRSIRMTLVPLSEIIN